MENLEVDNETMKNTYNKEEIKKELHESLINCERYANTDIEEKARSAWKCSNSYLGDGGDHNE